MKVSSSICLSGGVFFNLVILSIKEKVSKRDSFVGKSSGLSDKKVMSYLMDVIKPDRIAESEGSFTTNVSSYKNCNYNGGTYIILNDRACISMFDSQIKSEFQVLLGRMITFVDKVIDIDNKGKWLVKALLDVIAMDNSIVATASFYICRDGKPVQKRELSNRHEYDINAFLLGVLHYIMVECPDNKSGKEFLNKYFKKSSKYVNAQYTGGLGENCSDIILVKAPEQIGAENVTVNKENKVNMELSEIFFDRENNKLHLGNDTLDVLPELMPPQECALCESVVIDSLYRAYCEDLSSKGKSIVAVDDLPKKYKDNLKEQRINFYSALRMTRIIEAVIYESEKAIQIWKDNTYDYISDTANDDYLSGYKKLCGVMKKVVDIPPITQLDKIQEMIRFKERKGCCHLLVQDGRLNWSANDEID